MTTQIFAVMLTAAAVAAAQGLKEHALALPSDVALTLIGSYDLTTPTPAGVKDVHIGMSDNKLRLRIGDEERQLVAEGLAVQSTNGQKTADVYKFSLVGRVGVQVSFRVSEGRVTSLLYVDDVAVPPVMLTGIPK